MTDVLRREALLFARYLLDVDPSEAIIDRYRDAIRSLKLEDEADARLRFAERHPWSLSLLDSAAGLSSSRSPLRRRLLVMAAILETTPEHADRFLVDRVGVSALAVTAARAGLRSLVRAPLGLLVERLAQLTSRTKIR